MGKRKMFEGEGYNISIVSKNITLTEAIENYVLGKVSKVERFANHILDITVTLDVQKVTNTVTIVMRFLHFKIKVQAQTEDMYSSIDKATDKLLRLIKKYKTKLQSHRVSEKPDENMSISVLEQINDIDDINDQINKENLKEEEELYKIHEVIPAATMPLRTFTQEEAVMKFELSGDDFLIYQSVEDTKIKVMFRRKDEKIGIIRVV